MHQTTEQNKKIETLLALAKCSDYSFVETLHSDPQAKENGLDHDPRQVFSGHYVTVKPTAIEDPQYIAHSKTLFAELGLADSLVHTPAFVRMFSANLSEVPAPMKKAGWACGYALSIFGTEYYQQCPFQTGNGYGDGRAISVFEGLLNGKRWEMQLKGAGRTPYCRGADGRAVLRSSIREFLAQEHMHALGVPTSRSLSLFTSTTEQVQRPWYSQDSHAKNPDMMVWEEVAISTRVAPSFIRVGQLELFARRARKREHPHAMQELEALVLHLIDREYSEIKHTQESLPEQIVLLARAFGSRLSALVANWIRVGYCQGNFNSDNCAAGGFTLDYGPFGFCDVFDANYQPWTGGGAHFAFLNQPFAAERNFHMFCKSLEPLLLSHREALFALDAIREGFSKVMTEAMEKMWASKLGLKTFNAALFTELKVLMLQTSVDYTLFFRVLSDLPEEVEALTKSFYKEVKEGSELDRAWRVWLEKWRACMPSVSAKEERSEQMKGVNPKYTLREWLLVPAYQQAKEGDYTLVKELQAVMTQPYKEQAKEIEEKYYRRKPSRFFAIGGISHISCSS